MRDPVVEELLAGDLEAQRPVPPGQGAPVSYTHLTLPTITPSIGFTVPPTPDPLGDFMASLTKVRALPDLRVLPAHGPVAPSSHARVDELLVFHEERLDRSAAALADGPLNAAQVATHLGWTRHLHAYDELDIFSKGMAAMETKAHLELLVARGQATRSVGPDSVVTFELAPGASAGAGSRPRGTPAR